MMVENQTAYAYAGNLPADLVIVAGTQPESAQSIAERSVLTLDITMQEIYENSLANFKKNFLARRPVILALFTNEGGRMILYRPGRGPEEAPPVPVQYQLYKSVSHSSMAIYEIVSPYLANPGDKAWHGPMRSYCVQQETALEGLTDLDLSGEHRDVLEHILTHNIRFMRCCLENGGYTVDEVKDYARGLVPSFKKTIAWAAQHQVGHWMDVIGDWKQQIGSQWDETYAATNSLFVARQNNILFTVLAQFMGQKAIGERLLLIETPEFTSTPEQIFDVLARIVSDRTLGEIFFKDYFLMDVELLGSGARMAIAQEAEKRGMEPLLPPRAPFRSNDWPWRTDPNSGTGPCAMEEVK